MKIAKYLFLVFLLLIELAYANQFELSFSGSVDTTISDVASGGWWEDNSRSGNRRLIVRNLGWEHTRSFLYLQWLEVGQKSQKITEFKTIPIPEFNNSNWHNVSKVEYDYEKKAFIVTYVIRAQEETGSHTVTILPGLPNRYKIKFN